MTTVTEPRPIKRGRGCLIFLVSLILMIGCFAMAVMGFAHSLVDRYSQDLPDVERLRSYQPSETTRIYAANGELIATLFKENRTPVPIEKIPMSFRQAVLAIEDSRFYVHHGVDFVGVLRAIVTDYKSGGATQGASTITMQLARNIFLHPRATPQRKIQEMLIAMQLEKKFTKEEILELYLNQIYFGSGAYGIEAAAETYFDKKATALTLAESAMIAGMPAAPSEYSPQVNFRLAKHRQILVLKRMVDVGFVSQAQALEAIRQPLKVAEPRPTATVMKLPYFTTYVLHELFQKYDEDLLYRGGLRVYTTVDPKMQEAAEESIRWGIKNIGLPRNVKQAALVAIDPKTGYIRAMAGGLGWNDKDQFNRAWQTQRQPGSSFKMFVYSTAIEAGMSPDTVVPDSPVSFKVGPTETWTPKNSGGSFMGAIPLRTALQHSRNVVSARLTAEMTPDRVIDTAYKMGVKSHIEPNLSISLGAVAVSPLEMASAFSVLANGGVHVDVSAIKMIRDPDGNVIEDNTYPYRQEVLSAQTAFAMTEMLQNAVEHGTGYPARMDGRPVAGKTGTTDSHRDAWFCGFTPQLAAAVWAGNDDNSKMWGTFGGDISAPIWRHFMEKALKGQKVIHFGANAKGEVDVAMCEETHLRATTVCPNVTHKTYPWQQVPQHFCSRHVYGRRASSIETKERKDKDDKKNDDEGEGGHKAHPEATPIDEQMPEEVPVNPGPSKPNTPEQPTPIHVPSGPKEPETAPAPEPPAPAPPPVQAPPKEPPAPPKPPQEWER